MYRMFCESLPNMQRELQENEDSRSKLIEDFSILLDSQNYLNHKNEDTLVYKRISDLLFYMSQHIDEYPRFKCFLWTIEARGIVPKYYGIESLDVLDEKAKMMHMLLNTTYWN